MIEKLGRQRLSFGVVFSMLQIYWTFALRSMALRASQIPLTASQDDPYESNELINMKVQVNYDV